MTESGIDKLCRHAERLLAVAGAGVRSISMRSGDASVELAWQDTAGETGQAIAAAEAAPVVDRHVVRSPMVGTFYTAPSPGAEPFVRAGDLIDAGQQVAIVEAMKMMNPVAATSPGRVLEILVDDAQTVEFDQPLIVFEPPGEGDHD